MKKRNLAMYIRLSDADRDVAAGYKEESDSITNQRALLYSYIQEHEEFKGFDVLEYFDDGFSGTDFGRRQEFQRMMRDAEKGVFDTILVKDLSRFGRDYLEVGNYLEFVLPAMGVRFIAVNDGYDSYNNFGMTSGMDVAFKNLIYQMYSRDLSRKVKSARKNRNMNGEYTAAFVCYGYRKDPEDKHKLLVEEETAEVVREIFSLAIDGKNCNEIARILNERKIPTRLQNQWNRGIRFVPRYNKGDMIWAGGEVRTILNNEQYTGVMIQNKVANEGRADGHIMIRKLDHSEWSIVPDGIPAIISRETFEAANSMRRRIKKVSCFNNSSCHNNRKVNLFVCPYCERKLIHTRHQSSKYVCEKRRLVRESECNKVYMLTEQAEKAVLDVVCEEATLRLNLLEKKKDIPNSMDDLKKQITQLSSEYARIEGNRLTEYTKYRSGIYTKEEYMNITKKDKDKMEEIQSRIDILKEILQEKRELDMGETENDVRECSILKEYNGEVLSKLVEKVYIYNDKDIEVVFR